MRGRLERRAQLSEVRLVDSLLAIRTAQHRVEPQLVHIEAPHDRA